MVRLPWGSMSQQSTRWPSSAKATARLSVVVVFATPPFWLANAITLQVGVTDDSDASRNSYAPVFAGQRRIPPRHSVRGANATPKAPAKVAARARAPRQAVDLRHRQGRRGQIDRGHRARHAGRAPRTANYRGGTREPGARSARVHGGRERGP